MILIFYAKIAPKPQKRAFVEIIKSTNLNEIFALFTRAQNAQNAPLECMILCQECAEILVDFLYEKAALRVINADFCSKIINPRFFKLLLNECDSREIVCEILHILRILGHKARQIKALEMRANLNAQDSQILTHYAENALFNTEILLRNFKENPREIACENHLRNISLLTFLELDSRYFGLKTSKSHSLTSDQITFFTQFSDFLDAENEHIFILNGYAGTGKTHAIALISAYLNFTKRALILASPTGRAAQVASNRLISHSAQTIHSLLYTMENIAPEMENATHKLIFSLRENKNPSNCVYIFDEASMISNQLASDENMRFGSGNLLVDLFQFIDISSNKKVLFVGDGAQLPPIKMQYSPALDKSEIENFTHLPTKSANLSQVVRQKHASGILKTALNLRESLKNGDFYALNFVFDSSLQKIPHENLLALYAQKCAQLGLQNIKMIAFTNNEVDFLNAAIRRELGKKSALESGDLLIITKNHRDENSMIFNGDFIVLQEILGAHEVKTLFFSKDSPPLRVSFADILFKNAQGAAQKTKIIFSYFECLENGEKCPSEADLGRALFFDFKARFQAMYEKKKMKLLRESPELGERGVREAFYRAHFNEYLMSDAYYNALRVKFGYAITCHKAQGGEWSEVFIQKPKRNPHTADYFRWLYTAITRAVGKVYVVD